MTSPSQDCITINYVAGHNYYNKEEIWVVIMIFLGIWFYGSISGFWILEVQAFLRTLFVNINFDTYSKLDFGYTYYVISRSHVIARVWFWRPAHHILPGSGS